MNKPNSLQLLCLHPTFLRYFQKYSRIFQQKIRPNFSDSCFPKFFENCFPKFFENFRNPLLRLHLNTFSFFCDDLNSQVEQKSDHTGHIGLSSCFPSHDLIFFLSRWRIPLLSPYVSDAHKIQFNHRHRRQHQHQHQHQHEHEHEHEHQQHDPLFSSV
eukprot:Pompholyxophrys_punicea_v1_NODE_238_length_2605_cov_3.283529.p2 type:complete len:158 gc:universal NODE_238_length_2605_cov_3.283529:759-286(-)